MRLRPKTIDNRPETVNKRRLASLLFIVFLIVFVISGCRPTYPREKFRESIVDLCKKEYNIDVKVETIGKTIAIYIPLTDLIDFTFAITKDASEKINDVILSVSRVSLSSDADYDFYCVIAHDIRIPEIQIVIIKSVQDVKRFLLNDISRGEYSKRMLIDIRMSPQAQKEKSIKEVFEKMELDKKWQDQVMNDFFRSEPSGLGDIGYWNDHFYIKQISMMEFVAEQIANRIKMEFREDKNLSDKFILKQSKGTFVAKGRDRYFNIEVLAEPKKFGEHEDIDAADSVFLAAVKVASHVIAGYRFRDFDYVRITDQGSRGMLTVGREDLEKFRKKKMTFDEITGTGILS